MENEQIPPVEIDPDFQPQSRPRSCTWPLPRPDISAVKQEGVESAVNTPPTEDEKPEVLPVISEPENGNAPEGEILAGGAGAAQRKGPSRRNAWGNQSYADLISQAIENSPEKRLTLAQIYDWMVNTVPYFKDKGDSNSSAGWKNSIRHNLSLHSKFLRVHNESTGKSSWWMLNPEGGKSGKTPRRRAASMDNSSKLLKSRVRAAKTKKQTTATSGITQEGQTGNTENPGNGSQQQFPKWNVNSSSPSSRGSMEDPDIWTAFRPRTSSNASTLSGRLSPIAPGHEDDDDLGDDDLHTTLATYSASSVPPTLTETLMEDLELIDSLNLISSQQNNSSSTSSVNTSSSVLPSAAVLLQRSSSFSSYPQLQQSKPQLAQNNNSTGGTAVSSFGNSLFSPLSSTAGANRVGGHFSSSVDGTRLPTSLETLLTSDSPPPSDVMMSQVDPIMPSPSSTSLHILSSQLNQGKLTGQIILGKNQEQNSSLNLTLQQQQRTHLLGNSAQALGLGMLVQGVNSDSSNIPALKPQLPQGPSSPSGLLVSGVQSSVGSIPGISQFSGAGCFLPGHDKLPNDLDIEMFTENLDCDVDYIINSDLMDGDGMDFNFDPILTTNQNFSTSSTTPNSSHSWVPS